MHREWPAILAAAADLASIPEPISVESRRPIVEWQQVA
jgi:hypothetical protein